MDWTRELPHDGSWLEIPPTRNARSMRVVDLPIAGKAVRKFFSFKNHKPGTYTFIASFILPETFEARNNFLGLYVDQIAEVWQIYLNGSMIKDELFIGKDGEITTYRDQRRVLVYINPVLLNKGVNILAFKIVGDPTLVDTGFYTNKPLVIDNYEKLAAQRQRLIQLILIFVYLVAGLYLLLLFFFRRTELYNLIFAIFSIMFFIYLFCRTSTVYSVITDTRLAFLLEFCSAYTLIPLILCFMGLILYGRIKPFVYIYGIFCLLLIVLSVASPYAVRIDILRIWQMTAIVPAAYFVTNQIGRAFMVTVRQYRASFRDDMRPSMFKSIWTAMVKTVPGNLMVGALVAVTCALLDIIDSMVFTTGIVFSNYGFFVFIIGITLVISNRYIYLYNEIDGLSVDLRQKIKDLKETRTKYGISQEKYRLLVEGSTDIIFSMDEKFNIITANEAMRRQLHISNDELLKKNLFDLLQETDELSFSMHLLKEKLDRVIREKKPLNLKLDFKTPFGIEPVSLQVRLECITIDGKYEVFGRGSSISEDILNQYMESEKHSYRIGNLLLVADDLSFRITRNLIKYISRRDISFIRMAIREIIINAIEHGNLEITFEEKTRELDNDNYFTYLKERQNNPEYSTRKVHVNYSVDEEKVEYIVVDEGKGFNYLQYIGTEDEVNEAMLTHGRGISLARNIFDEVRYNEAGNAVSLIKWLKKDS